MAKVSLLELLSSLTKDELKEIAEDLGIKKLSVNKIILAESILQIVNVKDLNIILDYLYKDTLKWLNSNLDLPVSNRINDVLKKQIYDYYNNKNNNEIKVVNLSKKIEINKIKTINENTNKIVNVNTNQIVNVNTNQIVKKNPKVDISHPILSKIILEFKYFKEAHLKKSVDETHLTDILLLHLNSHFGTAQSEYRIGGYFDLMIDIDISDGVYGLEVKKWNSLKSSSAELTRAIGQAYIYSKKRYKENNYSFVLFGLEDDKKNQRFLDFEKIINELNGNVIFISVDK